MVSSFQGFLSENPRLVHLRVLETTDVHGYLCPYDYYTDTPSDAVGLVRTATLIGQARAECVNTLLFDNGDFLHGNPMGDRMVALSRDRRCLHPAIAAMNTLRYDGAALGNHEFNFGMEFLKNAIGDAGFPMLCANLRHRNPDGSTGASMFTPWAVIDRQVRDGMGQNHNLRIGIIGLLPPQVMMWDRRHLIDIAVAQDIVACAREELPRLKAARADIVIALCHAGIGQLEDVPGQENAALALATLPDIDAVLVGHSHRQFPSPDFEGMAGVDVGRGTLAGKPAVMAGVFGSHLGVIDLALHKEADGWNVVAHRCSLRPIAKRVAGILSAALVENASEIAKTVEDAHQATLSYIRAPVGKTDRPLHSYFAQVAPDLAMQVVAEAQRAHFAERLAGTPYAGLPILSATAPLKAGGLAGPGYYTEVQAGQISIRSIADLQVFPDTVRAVCITGAMLRGWLERAAGQFHQIVPGQSDQMLLAPDFPSYNFDVLHGVSYVFDISQPSRYSPRGDLVNPTASRISDLLLDGQPVADSARLVVATNNYRADGGGSTFPPELRGSAIIESTEMTREVLIRHIEKVGRLAPVLVPVWRFAPMPGTSVLFDTGPRAVLYASDVTALRMEQVGLQPDGFLRFRIHL